VNVCDLFRSLTVKAPQPAGLQLESPMKQFSVGLAEQRQASGYDLKVTGPWKRSFP
jgi:hypothetical protein